jgi:ketosteroid isomerase-like protein
MTAQEELLALNHRLAEAERKKDVETLRQLMADDYVGIDPAGNLLTKNVVLERFGLPELVYEHLATDAVTVRVYGEVGIVSGRSTIRGRYGAQNFNVQARYTDIYVRRDNQWQVVGSQMTPLQQPSPH